MRIDLREKNAKVIKRVIENCKEAKNERETFKAQWGVDPTDPNMLKEGFSFKKAAEKMAAANAAHGLPDFVFQRGWQCLQSQQVDHARRRRWRAGFAIYARSGVRIRPRHNTCRIQFQGCGRRS